LHNNRIKSDSLPCGHPAAYAGRYATREIGLIQRAASLRESVDGRQNGEGS
jgi:hypothetical protein